MNAEPGFAAAAARNAGPILGVLKREFAEVRRVLEIGSGTGLHATHFAAALPQLIWQTSDLDENHAEIRAQLDAAGCDNVLPPLSLDVRTATRPPGDWDAIFACNTKHIMSAEAVERMLELVAASLNAGGRYAYYGPFRRAGSFTTDSNAAFDASLRARDPQMGLRDLETIIERLRALALECRHIYAMPANNLLVIWHKTGANA